MKHKIWTSAVGCFIGLAMGSAVAVRLGMAEFSPRLNAALRWSEVRGNENPELDAVIDSFRHAGSSPSARLLGEMISFEAEVSNGQAADPVRTCSRLKISHCDLQRLRGVLTSVK